MTSGLTVTIDGIPVPLDECAWLEREPCGCIVSAVVAVVEAKSGTGWVLATADQARQHFAPKKRDRERAMKAGLTVELITMRYYREHIGAKWECAAHVPALAPSGVSVPPVPTPSHCPPDAVSRRAVRRQAAS